MTRVLREGGKEATAESMASVRGVYEEKSRIETERDGARAESQGVDIL